MCRSKKDGRKGGGHLGTRSKWREAKDRRRARTLRHAAREVILREFEDAAQAAEAELQQDYFDTQDEWSWTSEYTNYSDREAMSRYDMDDFDYSWMDDVVAPDYYNSLDPEPRADVFAAVDRAVRRHGLAAVEKQISLLAAALDVPSWEVVAALQYTPAGYIRRLG